MPRYSQVLTAGMKRLPSTDPTILELRLRIAYGKYLLGEWVGALRDLQSILGDADAKAMPELVGTAELYCGQLLIDLSDSSAAQAHLRAAVAQLTGALGKEHELVAEARADLGRSLAGSGKYAEAAAEFNVSQEWATRWAPPDTWTAVRPRFYTALMFIDESEPAKAAHILSEMVEYADSLTSAYMAKHKDSPVEADSSGPIREALGEAYARQGKVVEAIAILQRAMQLEEVAEGPTHPIVLSARLALAEALLEGQRDADAQEVLLSVPAGELSKLPRIHPIVARWNGVRGLIAMRRHNMGEAQSFLRTARDMYKSLYGPKNWRVVRLNQELSITTSQETSL
jgi:tetratricopeptide (TPR) repeat protein